MEAFQSIKKNKIYASIIIISMFFSPYTLLRIGRIGTTEILFTFLFFVVIIDKDLRINLKVKYNFIFTKFWLAFLLFSLVGVTYNYILLNHISGSFNSMIFDLCAYLFVAISCFIIEIMVYNFTSFDIVELLKKIYIYSSSSMLLLFIVSHYKNNLFGLPLTYYEYFSPFAANLHHIAMFIAPLPFLGLKMTSLEKKKLNKGILLVLVASNIITGIATGSSKVMVGFILGSMSLIFFKITSKLKNQRVKILWYLFLIITLSTFLAFYYKIATNYLIDLFIRFDGGGARNALYTSAINKGIKSLFIGYGPGAHIQFAGGALQDAHQTFLTVFLQAGIFGIIACFYLLWEVFNKCKSDAFIMGSITSIMIYVLGGDVMRKFPIWIFLVTFYYCCKRRDEFKKS